MIEVSDAAQARTAAHASDLAHDEVGPLGLAISALCIAGAGVLFAWNLLRLVAGFEAFPLWLPGVLLLSVLFADLVSGLVHWTADTWGSESLPVIGRRFLRPFRVHHANPDDFLRRRFIDTNGDVAMGVLGILAGALWIPLEGEAGRALAVFVVGYCAAALPTNQVHQWAHMPAPPRVIAALQRSGVLLGHEAHARHHRAPFDSAYCIATGWCNRPLEAIDGFRRLERAVTWLTGAKPRRDDAEFATSVGSRPAQS